MNDRASSDGPTRRLRPLIPRASPSRRQAHWWTLASITLAPVELKEAFAEARRLGSTTCDLSLESVRFTVEFEGVGVPTRRGGPTIGILEPRAADDAHPMSLSAKHGLGPFPLHTDGAHLRRPPDFTLLEAPVETDVPTLLFDLRSAALLTDVEHSFRNGVFAVGRGASSFYSHANDEHGGVRYDPGCMFPVDPLARDVRTWLAEAARSAKEHQWKLGETLVIANRRCLHGRPDVAENPGRVLRRLMLHWDR